MPVDHKQLCNLPVCFKQVPHAGLSNTGRAETQAVANRLKLD